MWWSIRDLNNQPKGLLVFAVARSMYYICRLSLAHRRTNRVKYWSVFLRREIFVEAFHRGVVDSTLVFGTLTGLESNWRDWCNAIRIIVKSRSLSSRWSNFVSATPSDRRESKLVIRIVISLRNITNYNVL